MQPAIPQQLRECCSCIFNSFLLKNLEFDCGIYRARQPSFWVLNVRLKTRNPRVGYGFSVCWQNWHPHPYPCLTRAPTRAGYPYPRYSLNTIAFQVCFLNLNCWSIGAMHIMPISQLETSLSIDKPKVFVVKLLTRLDSFLSSVIPLYYGVSYSEILLK